MPTPWPQPPRSAEELIRTGQFDLALVAAQRRLIRRPGDVEASHQCALALCGLARFEQAVFYARRAADAEPTAAHCHTLAQALAGARLFDQSADWFRRAITLSPGDHDLRIAFARMLFGADDHEAVLSLCEETLAHSPPSAEFATTQISVIQNLGDTAGAIAIARDWLTRHGDHPGVLQSLVLALNGSPEADPQEVFDLHTRLGAAITRGIPAPEIAGHRRAGPVHHRRLRIGYLSSDLHTHSVAYFLEPVLRCHDADRFEVFVYSTGPVADETTARLHALGHRWRDARADSDPDLARRIHADGVDILIELNGHTVGGRMGVMARRPAPVQATYIGYPNTTGLPAIQHRLVDAVTDPPGADRFCTELLTRLTGCFLCYRPHPPAVPATRNPGSTIVFGSFNNAAKLAQPVARLWAQLIQSVPGSSLVLKSTQFRPEQVRRRFHERFNEAGIETGRLRLLLPTTTPAEHLRAYDTIDIALDPFPYNGTATTCEALCSGVPVVTLRGTTHAGRVGASLLSAAGLPEWIAETEEEYLRIATTLAADRARLADLHRTLRKRVTDSRLCDARAGAAALETALVEMWQRWLAGG